ncbi:MAG: ROK family transcriptional regulator [Chloroflexi bacterium]|nr:ROK family transcriptional regulator [Chloroflexota bacterium]
MEGHNATTMKLLNRGVVLHHVLRLGPLTRRQLARKTGLRKSTISYIIAELLAAGLVREVPPLVGRPGRPGRQEALAELVPDGAYAIGVHVGILGSQVALTNARAQIVGWHTQRLPSPPTPQAVVAQITRLIDTLVASAGIDRSRLIGVGVGVLAYVEPDRGVVRLAPSLGWHDVPLAAVLQEAVGLPVRIEHNVRAMALAEQLFGRLGALRDFALINVGTSIGTALVVNGQLAPGHSHSAGQIGHLPVAEDGLPCVCGKRGCLDTVASWQAFDERAQDLARRHPDSAFAASIRPGSAPGPASAVLRLAGEGDTLACSIVDGVVEHLAVAVAYLLALLDPEVVVLCAGSSFYDHVLIAPVQRALTRRAAMAPVPDARIVPSSFGVAQAVVGGAAVALQRLFKSPDMLDLLMAGRPAGLR